MLLQEIFLFYSGIFQFPGRLQVFFFKKKKNCLGLFFGEKKTIFEAIWVTKARAQGLKSIIPVNDSDVDSKFHNPCFFCFLGVWKGEMGRGLQVVNRALPSTQPNELLRSPSPIIHLKKCLNIIYTELKSPLLSVLAFILLKTI